MFSLLSANRMCGMITLRLGEGECWGEGGRLMEQQLAPLGVGGAKLEAELTLLRPLWATVAKRLLRRLP